jgi:probable F420-dependent oxidoreductase
MRYTDELVERCGEMKIDAGLLSSNLAQSGAEAARAEAQGFGGVWSVESAHDPFLPLALASQATQRIDLGTSVAIAFARNPMNIAQLAWDVQTLARGRFILGLGTQIKPHVERRFSMPWSKPVERLREFVLAIRAIWRTWQTGEELSFQGEFYTHNLMIPVFNPGPNEFGAPPIYLAGVNPRMVEAVGEVADGFIVHALNSPSFLEAETIPALERGLAKSGRLRKDFPISCQTIVALGGTPAQIEMARQKARLAIAYFGSSFRSPMEHHGYGGLHLELDRLRKAGDWSEMLKRIDDTLLDHFAVSGTALEVGRRLRERNADFAARTMLLLYDESGDPEAPHEIIKGASAT